MVLVKDIESSSLCEHHLMPFVGKAHVALYTQQIHHPACRRSPAWWSATPPAGAGRLHGADTRLHQRALNLGVAVVIEASHMCMQMRGIETGLGDNDVGLYGVFLKDTRTREEFLT